MAAHVVPGFVHRDIVFAAQVMSRHHAGNAGTDYRDSHCVGSPFVADLSGLPMYFVAGTRMDAPTHEIAQRAQSRPAVKV
jgi:hypothetical protein